MRNILIAVRNILIAVAAAAVLGACAVGPDYHRPQLQAPAAFAGAAEPVYSSDAVRVRFWMLFGDDTLDRLEDDALAANHDLRIAVAHLQASRALLSQDRLDLAPTVTSGGGYTRQEYPPSEAFGSPTALDERYYDAGFDASWELDLFGRVRREVQAGRAEVERSEATLQDARVSVTAEVASTYFELRGAQTELDVRRRNVDNQRSTLQLTQSLLDAGRGTELDTQRAEAQLRSTLADIPPLQAEVARDIHRLGVLTGREPEALRDRLALPRTLPALPRVTAIGDPAGLLRRRPDIRAAERELAASTARIGVAVGDLFPKVTFDGNFGYAAGQLSQLGTAGARTFLIGPSISWAAFDLGRVRARIRGARADTDAALASYQQTVLRALEETENALVTHARTRDQLVQLAAAADASHAAAGIARARYQGGLVGFLEVLDAERTELQADAALAQARTDAATSLVALYKALGGSWQQAPAAVQLKSAAPVAAGHRALQAPLAALQAQPGSPRARIE
ncbi:MAG TPA: efflux transporter outer membrane subunit [Steroidobacteraceae bacterium]|nr:efflux transporter outer membrane subunit [Steroidobacteraceae bacterium]